MANSFILLADLKAKCCSNSAEVRFAEAGKHMKSILNMSEASKEIEERSQLHKVMTVNSTMMARGTYGIDTILQPTIFMKQKRMSEEVSRESTSGSVSASGMLYTGVKKLETVMVDAVCFNTFTSLLIVQS
ncbi:hypothetical protein YC2023_115007 [Brassica napus]